MFFAVAFLCWSIGALMGYCLSSCRLRSRIEKTEPIEENQCVTVRVSGTVWKLPSTRTLVHFFRDCQHLRNSHGEPSHSKLCEDCIKRAKKQA